MRRKRSADDGSEQDTVIDLRERLAPYGETAPTPGWRDVLIAADARRRARPLRAEPLPSRRPVG
jgi:hypothetical protein